MKLKTKLICGLLLAALTASWVAPGVVSAQAKPDTFDNYSRISQQSAGDFFDKNNHKSGQWSWRAEQGVNQWSINWDQPRPDDRYYFQLSDDGNWVEQKFWTAHGTRYDQRVNFETVNGEQVPQDWYGDGNCQNMQRFKSKSGYEKYARKAVGGSYCVLSFGTVTEASTGKVFNYHHRIQWSSPQPCSNRYIANQTCIKQSESWADDNGHDFREILVRDEYYARGLGEAFSIKQHYRWENGKVLPYWEADARDYWNWYPGGGAKSLL